MTGNALIERIGIRLPIVRAPMAGVLARRRRR